MNDTTFQGNGSVKYVPVVVDTKPKPITNADRIRAMTDEELAEFLNGTDGDFLPTGEALTVSAGKNRWLDWLREEATDGEQS